MPRKSTPVVEAVVETITPEKALEYLDANHDNRSIRQTRVDLYALQMKQGLWRLTGEAIIFATNGDVKNGQHRLYGCIQADKPFTTLVVRGVDSEAFDLMDSGLTRTHGDMLQAHGLADVNVTAAAARLYVGYESDLFNDGKAWNLATNKNVILNEVMKRQDLYARAARIGGATRRAGANASSVTGFYDIASATNQEEDVAEWLDGLASGVGLKTGDSRIALRNWLTNQRRHKNYVHLASLIRAWNAYTVGQNLSLIRTWVPGQPFPEVASL